MNRFLAAVLLIVSVPLAAAWQRPERDARPPEMPTETATAQTTSASTPSQPQSDATRNSGWLVLLYMASITLVAVIPLAVNVAWAYKYERDIRTKLIEYATAASVSLRDLEALVIMRSPPAMPGLGGSVVMVTVVVVAITVVHTLGRLDGVKPESHVVLALFAFALIASVTAGIISQRVARRNAYGRAAAEFLGRTE